MKITIEKNGILTMTGAMADQLHDELIDLYRNTSVFNGRPGLDSLLDALNDADD